MAKRLPEVSPELRRYFECVWDGARLSLHPPLAGLSFSEGRARAVLNRDGEFQAELILFAPGVKVEPHSHPDVESIDLLISGSAVVMRDGREIIKPRPARYDGMTPYFGMPAPIPVGVVHAGIAGSWGACVLSVQRWLNGVKPTHVVENWKPADAA